MRPKSPWSNAHVRLKRLYDERVPPDVKQKDFGKRYGIGSQSMVAQYLTGATPLNYAVAAKFARALNCTIYEICPEMGDSIKEELLPVLGKALRRAAMVLLAIALQHLAPSDAYARAVLHKQNLAPHFYAKGLNVIHIVSHWLSVLISSLLCVNAQHKVTPYAPAG